MAPAAVSATRSMTAARKTLLARRAKLARLALGGELDRRELSAERRAQAENEEIAGVLAELTERERLELGEIDAALTRMDAGAWGACEKCGGQIPRPRLVAMPEARSCVTCG